MGKVRSFTSPSKMRKILLVEDNEGDQVLVQEALIEAKIVNELVIAKDGEEAMEAIDREIPLFIFLDLNLPKMDGRDVLKKIRENDRTRNVPVVILTSSTAEEDIVKSYDLCANCFVSKPLNFEKFMHVVASVADFWLTIVQIPRSTDEQRIAG